jgi:hypothetical protein
MSHCCFLFDLRFLIILLVSSSFPCKGTFCTTTIERKKNAGKLRHFRLRDWRHFRLCVTSGHETNVTSGYDVTSGHMTDVTSGSTEQQYSQSNDEESYYILKTNNPFLFENLYTVMYFMQYSHCYCCLCHVNRIHTCNTINILIGHQLFNGDFFYKWWEMFCYIVSDKNGEMYQRSYSVINVDVHWWMISNWSNVSVYFSLVVNW